MGFFGKQPEESAQPSAPPPAQQPPQAPPASVEPPAQPQQTEKAPKLPREIQDIIEAAGKSTRDRLFKDKENIDASE